MGVIKNKKWFFIFLLPGLLFYILSVFYPIEESIRLSFMEWNGIGDKTFAGLQNYVTMFHDPTFYKSFFKQSDLSSYCGSYAAWNRTCFCCITDFYEKTCDIC